MSVAWTFDGTALLRLSERGIWMQQAPSFAEIDAAEKAQASATSDRNR